GQIDPYLGGVVRHHACSHGGPHTLFSCLALANLSPHCQCDLNNRILARQHDRSCVCSHGGLEFPFVHFCTRKSEPNDWELKIHVDLMCFSYGSSLLILSAYTSSMPLVLSLPLYMACDDSDRCVTTTIEVGYCLARLPLSYAAVIGPSEPNPAISGEFESYGCLWRNLTKRKQNTQKNKAGLIHKQAEEKRTMVVAKKSEDNLKADARLAPDSRGVLYILSDVY
nr:hypothetical protein [Tanacetum cinerariifolium]